MTSIPLQKYLKFFMSLLILLIGASNIANASSQIPFLQVIYDGTKLDGVGSVIISPDGQHVYTTSYWDGTLAAFHRDRQTGDLTFIESHRDGLQGIDGLDGAQTVTMSQDGRYLYIASRLDNAIAVFHRDEVSGALTFSSVYKDGQNGLYGLLNAYSVTISPNQQHLYVATRNGGTIVAFNRDETTGALSLIEVHQDGQNGIDSLAGASSIAVSPDGKHLYVASQYDDAITVFDRDELTGTLTLIEAYYDDQNGVDGLEGATSVIISSDGKQVHVAGRLDGAIAVFNRDQGTGKLTFIEKEKGVHNGSSLIWPDSVTISPDEKHLYVADSFGNHITMFSRDPMIGTLTFVERHKDGQNGVDHIAGANSIIVSSDGQHVYVTASHDSAVTTFKRDSATGLLSFASVILDEPDVVNGLKEASAVIVSPDGQHLYVTGNEDDAVAVFRRNQWSAGMFAFVEVHKEGQNGLDGTDGASAVTISSDGQYLYVTGGEEPAVVVFKRDQTTGMLTFIELQRDDENGVDGLNGASAVTISPDDQYLYVASKFDDAVAVFYRNKETGVLTFIELQRDNENGVDGLNGASAVTISPDGQYLYATSQFDDAIAVFYRNKDTGGLTFTHVYQDDQNGVNGLDRAKAIAISPNGQHLYVAGQDDEAIAAFDRDDTTGSLTFIGLYIDEIDGVDGLDGVNAISISPNGQYLYSTSQYDDAVAIFSRDEDTGTLTFIELQQDEQNGVDGLDGASGITISPDSQHLYVTGGFDDAIVGFGTPNMYKETTFLPLLMKN